MENIQVKAAEEYLSNRASGYQKYVYKYKQTYNYVLKRIAP